MCFAGHIRKTDIRFGVDREGGTRRVRRPIENILSVHFKWHLRRGSRISSTRAFDPYGDGYKPPESYYDDTHKYTFNQCRIGFFFSGKSYYLMTRNEKPVNKKSFDTFTFQTKINGLSNKKTSSF